MKVKHLFLLAAFGLMATACGNLDNPLENIQGGGISEEEITKYEFKVTDLSADNDITHDITVLKLTNEAGADLATATYDAEKGVYTVERTKLASATTVWVEATTVDPETTTAKTYIQKLTAADLTALETSKTLAMATIGDVILTDGKFAAPSTTSAKAAMIAYIGDDADGSDATNPNKWHGLAIALADESTSPCAWAGTCATSGVSTSSTMAGHKAFLNGIADTETLITKYGDGYAAAKAKNYETTVAAPAGTSGWFLPSSGQWLKFFEAAGVDVTGWTSWGWAPAPSGGTQADNWTKVNTLMETAAAGSSVKQDWYWSSSEYDEYDAVGVLFRSGDGVALGNDLKSHANIYVRSFLAF